MLVLDGLWENALALHKRYKLFLVGESSPEQCTYSYCNLKPSWQKTRTCLDWFWFKVASNNYLVGTQTMSLHSRIPESLKFSVLHVLHSSKKIQIWFWWERDVIEFQRAHQVQSIHCFDSGKNNIDPFGQFVPWVHNNVVFGETLKFVTGDCITWNHWNLSDATRHLLLFFYLIVRTHTYLACGKVFWTQSESPWSDSCIEATGEMFSLFMVNVVSVQLFL